MLSSSSINMSNVFSDLVAQTTSFSLASLFFFHVKCILINIFKIALKAQKKPIENFST